MYHRNRDKMASFSNALPSGVTQSASEVSKFYLVTNKGLAANKTQGLQSGKTCALKAEYYGNLFSQPELPQEKSDLKSPRKHLIIIL